MPGSLSILPSPHTAGSLRRELNARALARAARLGLRHELTPGRSPSVIFGPESEPCNTALAAAGHGNFHPESYRAISQQPDWARRLAKAHTSSLRALPRADWRWRELDCASSSDALLMNIFCHPASFADGRLAALLGVAREARPIFGVRPRVPLERGLTDTTEVDMQIGSLLVEAKLTEANFQTARPELVERFPDLCRVFDRERLPRSRATTVAEQWDEEQAAMVAIRRGEAGQYVSYQLIRNTLAAFSTGFAFCVLCDARRPDLVEAWHRVQRAVASAELRCRLLLLTWQEVAAVLPGSLQEFLDDKYGILPV